MRLYEAPTFALAGELEAPGQPRRLASFAFSPDGRFAFAGDDEGGVRAWDVDAGEFAGHLDAASGGVGRLAVADGGRTLAGGTDEGRIVLVGAARGERAGAWRARGGRVTALAFSADGRSFFSASDDGTLLAWATPDADSPG